MVFVPLLKKMSIHSIDIKDSEGKFFEDKFRISFCRFINFWAMDRVCLRFDAAPVLCGHKMSARSLVSHHIVR
jgi:hypothetical protein